MPGIIPSVIAGAVPATSPNVTNAHTPPDPFTFSCDYLALPNNCDARVTPAQMNAVVSEMLGLAACFDEDFIWNCSSLTNLCAAFQAWVAGQAVTDACAELTGISDSLRSRRVFAGSANGQILAPGGTSAIGTQGPSGSFSTVIVNADNCLPMHVIVSGDTNFQYSSNSAGTGTQQAISLARVTIGAGPVGAFTLLSASGTIPAATITGGAIWPASNTRGFLEFDIPPLDNATVDYATQLDTAIAPVTRSALLTTVGVHGWYDTSH